MKNKCDYKGVFYAKNESEQMYFEGGAHFRYIDLFNILKKIQKKNSLSQGKHNSNNNNNTNISTNKSKNKSSKNLLISENKIPINFLINIHKNKVKKMNSNIEENKSLSKSKNLNSSHNYNNSISKLSITQFLNLKINNNKNLYNISDLENSKLSNIPKEKKISYDNINLKHFKHQPKSRNSQEKKIKTKTKKENSNNSNNINNFCDYNDNNYNYFFLEEKIDKLKDKEKNLKKYKNKFSERKIINSINSINSISSQNNNYLDYFIITKITPKSRGSLNKNSVMLNIRKLKNKKKVIQKSTYNINDNSSINKIANSFIKKKKNRLIFDLNSKIGHKLTTNTTFGDDIIIKNNKNIFRTNKSPKINDSLYKKRNNMTLLTLNKFDENIGKTKGGIEIGMGIENINNNNGCNINKNDNNKNKKMNSNICSNINSNINSNCSTNKVLKYINQYIIKTNGIKRQNSRNNFYCSYRNKYILNDLPKKITDNTYNILKKNNNEINSNGNFIHTKTKINYKISSRNSILNNDKVLKSLEDH